MAFISASCTHLTDGSKNSDGYFEEYIKSKEKGLKDRFKKYKKQYIYKPHLYLWPKESEISIRIWQNLILRIDWCP